MAMYAQNTTIIAGSDQTYRITVVDANGVLVDLTGATVYYTVKQAASDAAALIAKTSATVTEIDILAQSGATLGQAEIYLVPADTSALLGSYLYDVWVEMPSGLQYAIVAPARLKVEAAITSIP